MSSSVEKIKERLSIVDVISSYITVEQSGKNYKARCPFHNEKTPSFFISSDRGSYYCFGCGAKGDIFSFVENFEGLDFLGSLKLLADRAGVVLDNTKQEEKDSKEEYFKIMEEATRFFEYNYENNAEVRAYLVSRGLRDETIKNFRIGYSLDGWSSLYNHLVKKGYREKDIEMVGLIKKGKTDKFYDRFRSRIMFPISDSSGRVIAFSGRIFYLSNSQKREDIEEAKYINSPDTPLFNKSNVLFGVDKAKTEIKKRGYSILVEGQMDLIMSHQFGFTNTIAVSGTALTDSLVGDENKINNLGLIKRLSSNIILAFDGDNAGQRAVGRSSLIALSLDMQVKVAELSGDEDPADIILREPDAWANIIKNSLNVIEFYLKKICEINLDTRIRGKKIREIIFPLLQSVKSSIERDSYIDMISKKIGISRDSILEDFNNFIKGFKIKEENKILVNDDKKLKRKDLLERNVMGIFFWRESQHHDILDIENHLRGIGIDYLNKIKENYTPYKEELIFEIERDYGGGKDEMIGRSIKEMILDLEEEYLKEKIKLLGEIGEEKLFEFNEIRKRIEEIKNNRLL